MYIPAAADAASATAARQAPVSSGEKKRSARRGLVQVRTKGGFRSRLRGSCRQGGLVSVDR